MECQCENLITINLKLDYKDVLTILKGGSVKATTENSSFFETDFENNENRKSQFLVRIDESILEKLNILKVFILAMEERDFRTREKP